MTTMCISDAIVTLEELLGCLDDAYWEASSLEGKDHFYNLINAIHQEMSELNKLSVQDHNLTYEIICSDFRLATTELDSLTAKPHNSVIRSKTAKRLGQAADALSKLLN
ncbi:hypothetical protein R50072_17180 [Simiduia litorea]|uniref:hypothetical protein n=1 Tax=Simiduia litorea TaxID=1435348 RepID=UPI0036F1D429